MDKPSIVAPAIVPLLAAIAARPLLTFATVVLLALVLVYGEKG